MKYVKLFEQFVSEGIWAFNKESIPNFIKDLRKAKSSKDIKKLKDKYYNLVGDDTLFDYLDRAESGDGDFSNNVGDAIGRLEDLSDLNEAIDINSLIGTLVNSMDSYDERDFIKFFKELGGSPKLAKTVFNDYWNVDAMDRMDWDTPDWKDWLFQRGIK